MAKQTIAPLVRGGIRLRLLEEADLPMTLAWHNLDEIRRWLIHSQVITPEQHREWWKRYLDRDDDLMFVIEAPAKLGRAVGQAGLYRIDPQTRTAEFGRLLIGDREARGLGLAKDATNALLDLAFEQLALDHVELEVMDANHAAQHVYEACGFREVSRRVGLTRMRRSRLQNCKGAK